MADSPNNMKRKGLRVYGVWHSSCKMTAGGGRHRGAAGGGSMRRACFLLAFALVAALPAAAFADGFEVRLGAFFPSTGAATDPDNCTTGCNIFQDTEALFGATKAGWTGPFGGIEYSRRVAPHVEIGLHIDGYGRKRETQYRDYTWQDDDSPIRQTLQVSAVPIGLSVRLLPTKSRAGFVPYVTAGADIIIWDYREKGDFIDFGTPGLDVNYDEFKSSGATPGLHVAAGFRAPISYDLSLTAEARYLFAKKTDMGGDFSAYSIDLSGASATVGLLVRF
jgi:hypothetical protein